MTIKLLLLKSGEDIISDIKEMVVGGENGESEEERRVVGYLLNKPCLVKMRDPSLLAEETTEEQKKASYQVSLYPWMPLSKDQVIPVPSDWVVTIVEPVNQVKEMYNQRIAEKSKNGKSKEDDQNTSINEQSDSNQSD